MTTPAARPGISPVVVAAISVMALALGSIGGTLFEKSRREPSKEAPSDAGNGTGGSDSRKSPGDISTDPTTSASTGAATTGDTSKKLAEAQAEITRLTQRVAELEKLVPKARTKEDKIALAKEMLDCLRKGKKDGEAFRRMLQLLSELDPEMGPFFLERLADPEEKAEKDTIINFAMAAGGPEVADWLLGQLTGAGLSEDEKRRLLRILGGGSKEIFSIRNLPVKGPLANLAFQYAASGTPDERMAAAGMLGGVDTLESRTALYRLAGSDSNPQVRDQAIRALAYVGDRDSLPWLDTMQASLSSLGDYEKKKLNDAVDSTREKLQKKYPQ